VALVKFLEHVDLDTAWSIIEKRISPLDEVENVDLFSDDPFGNRRLAKDILSLRNLPQYPSSAVDGYSIMASETAGASPATPVEIKKGFFAWVNTGGPVPQPFDAVVMVEDTFSGPETLKITKTVTRGENIRPEGEDIARGQIAARKGDLLTPSTVAMLIGSGFQLVPVARLPRTVFIPTGDEIVTAREWIKDGADGEGRVPETNSWMLQAIYRDWGYPLAIHELLRDDEDLIAEAVQKALGTYDLVIIGAGTAKGRRDHSAEVIMRVAEPLFRGVRMKPGRPVIAGISGNKPLIALPGFPMSSLVSAWSIVNPVLRRLSGEVPTVELGNAIGATGIQETKMLMHHSSQQGVREWVRVKCGEIEGTRYSWVLSGGSSSLFNTSDADGFSLLEDSVLEVPKESSLTVWLKKPVDWGSRIVYQGSNDPGIENIVTFLRNRGGDMAIRSVGSLGGLAAIARGEGHVASCHLLDPQTGRYNDAFISRFEDSGQWTRIRVYKREQGFLVQKGNPKNIRSIEDIGRNKISFVNRQPGAGTRVLFDHLLKKAGLEPESVTGYNNIAITHLEAAARVSAGSCDLTLGIKAAALAFGTDFIPIAEEDFELVIPDRFRSHPGIRLLIETLSDEKWRQVVEDLGGYTWFF